MNIVMILDQEFPPDPRVQNEASSLINAGHTLTLLCLDYKNKLTNEKVEGINVYRIKTPKIIYKLSALAYTFPFYRWFLSKKIKEFLINHEFDAIHVHDMRIGKTVLKSTQKIKTPKILDLHENRPEIMKYYEHVRTFPGNILIFPRIWKRWERKLVKEFDKSVVVTDEAKEFLINNYKISDKRVVVYPNTVHPSFYVSYKTEERILNRLKNNFIILYLGDTGERRGLETAIYAVEKLKKSIPNILLVIVGKSKNDNELKKLVEKLKLEKYVNLEGFQSMELFQSYIISSNICISPLHRNLHHDTTYANKIFQYMSLGVPVLVSDCTAQKNIVNFANAGLVHRAEDIVDFEAKVLKLYNSQVLTQQLGSNGKSFIKNKFNQNITSSELVDFYNKLL